jgi:hypothetical protein
MSDSTREFLSYLLVFTIAIIAYIEKKSFDKTLSQYEDESEEE